MLTLQTVKPIGIDDRLIEQWVNHILRAYDKPQAELTLRFVGKKEMLMLNTRYRNSNKTTNVLAFPSDLPAVINSHFIGDVIICTAVVKQQAKAQHKTLNAHTAHLIVHAILHLFGFDHSDDIEAQEMEGIEIKLLAELGFANPYQ